VIVVDASVWIDYFNGAPTPQADRLDGLLDTELIIVGDLTLAEVLQGFRRKKDLRRAHELLSAFPYRDMVGRDVALLAADHYRRLRECGVTVRKTIDVLIASFCIRNDLPLLHADRDFDAMERHLDSQIV
jgi:hypothetical protein